MVAAVKRTPSRTFMATTGVPSGVELTALLKDLSDKQELSDSLQKALANHHDVIAQLGNEMVALTKYERVST